MEVERAFIYALSISVIVLLSAELAQAEEEQADADQSGQEAEAVDADEGEAQGDAAGDADAAESGTEQMGRRVLHMEPQNVTGQWARAGAIQLVRRSPRPLQELVSLRTTFRDRIVHQVYRGSQSR